MLKEKFIYLFKSNWLSKFEYFLTALGTVWLSIEFPSFLIKDFANFINENSFTSFWMAISLSIAYSLIRDWPITKKTKLFKASNTAICIKVGDIFDEEKNIVIGSSDYFDTNFRRTDISLKSKMMDKYFNGNLSSLDNLISTSLSSQNISGQIDLARSPGKNVKYPIGTTAVIPVAQKRFFLSIITNLINNSQGSTTEASPSKLNIALNAIWKQIKNEGRMEEIAIPVLGSGLSGITLSRLMIIQSIIMSYSIFAKDTRISKKLNIIISKKDYDPEDFHHACKYLDSMQF